MADIQLRLSTSSAIDLKTKNAALRERRDDELRRSSSRRYRCRDLIPMIKGAPEDVVEAARAPGLLPGACSSTSASTGPIDTEAQMDLLLRRGNLLRAALASRTASRRTTLRRAAVASRPRSISRRKWRPLTNRPRTGSNRRSTGCCGAGSCASRADIVHASAIFAPFANVIFDHDRPRR